MNSHQVFVWDPQGRALPTTLEEALTQGRKLAGVREESSSKLQGFMRAMADYAAQDEDDEELQESIGDLEGTVGGWSALEIEMPPEGWETLIKVMVDYTSSHGLVLADEGMMLAFLPHGKVLPEAGAEEWQAHVRAVEGRMPSKEVMDKLPKTLKAFIKWAAPQYDEGMFRHGFTEKGVRPGDPHLPVYIRNVEYGKQLIVFDYAGKFPYFGANFTCDIYCDPVMEIYNKFKLHNIDRVFGLSLNKLVDFTGYPKKAIYEGSIERAMSLLEEYIIPLLDMGRDIKGLDKLVNGGG